MHEGDKFARLNEQDPKVRAFFEKDARKQKQQQVREHLMQGQEADDTAKGSVQIADRLLGSVTEDTRELHDLCN